MFYIGSYYKWNPLESDGSERILQMYYLACIVGCTCMIPTVITLYSVVQIPAFVFYNELALLVCGRFYPCAIVLLLGIIQLAAIANMVYLFQGIAFIFANNIIEKAMSNAM